MKKTLLCSFSILVMSPAAPKLPETKKERVSRKIEMLKGTVPFCLLTVYAQPAKLAADMMTESTTAVYAHPKPPRKKKKWKPRKNLYTTHPSKNKFSRDGSQLKIPK
jgi:hypothetical protein